MDIRSLGVLLLTCGLSHADTSLNSRPGPQPAAPLDTLQPPLPNAPAPYAPARADAEPGHLASLGSGPPAAGAAYAPPAQYAPPNPPAEYGAPARFEYAPPPPPPHAPAAEYHAGPIYAPPPPRAPAPEYGGFPERVAYAPPPPAEFSFPERVAYAPPPIAPAFPAAPPAEYGLPERALYQAPPPPPPPPTHSPLIHFGHPERQSHHDVRPPYVHKPASAYAPPLYAPPPRAPQNAYAPPGYAPPPPPPPPQPKLSSFYGPSAAFQYAPPPPPKPATLYGSPDRSAFSPPAPPPPPPPPPPPFPAGSTIHYRPFSNPPPPPPPARPITPAVFAPPPPTRRPHSKYGLPERINPNSGIFGSYIYSTARGGPLFKNGVPVLDPDLKSGKLQLLNGSYAYISPDNVPDAAWLSEALGNLTDSEYERFYRQYVRLLYHEKRRAFRRWHWSRSKPDKTYLNHLTKQLRKGILIYKTRTQTYFDFRSVEDRTFANMFGTQAPNTTTTTSYSQPDRPPGQNVTLESSSVAADPLSPTYTT